MSGPSKTFRRSARVVILLLAGLSIVEAGELSLFDLGNRWTKDFHLEQCAFSVTGRNDYFILEPDYQLVLTGTDEGDSIELTITVLNETKQIGSVETRIVEERETENGELTEVSRNYYAICTQTRSVFYFGEDVDVYEAGKIIGHDGSWRADSAGTSAGLMMSGIILMGARYFQEIAPDAAMDRGEIVGMDATQETPAGRFEHVLKVEESSALEPDIMEYKYYAPGIGLIRDGDLLLIRYGKR